MTMLNNPNGILFNSNKTKLYVANSGGSQVLVYTENIGPPFSLTQQVGDTISNEISSPTRLAFDANGFLYVTNLGNNTVTVHNPSTPAAKPVVISQHISRPLRVAVDRSGNVYVANNSADNITVYTGSPTSGFSYSHTLTQDGKGHTFLAPGALTFDVQSGLLYVGLGPTSGADSLLQYQPPLKSTSSPMGVLTNTDCPTNPTGPTGVCVVDFGDPEETQVYVSSYYNSSVTAYSQQQITNGGCVTVPLFTSRGGKSGIAQPEGVAVDLSRFVFVSNSSANTITVYSNLQDKPVYTQT